jgi:predicted amidohydrolase
MNVMRPLRQVCVAIALDLGVLTFLTPVAAQKADILVYPEFGLVSGSALSAGRADVLPYTVVIPGIAKVYLVFGSSPDILLSPDLLSTPCTDDNNLVLSPLSCFASNHSMVIVANVNERQPCINSTTPNCPPEGAFTYNTEVVFNERGALIAVYRKEHPWFTQSYNTPVNQSLITFETSFGVTFGLLICNDIRFAHPKDALVAAGVRHFPYSVAMSFSLLKWLYIERWSSSAGVAVLSANAGESNAAVYVRGATLASSVYGLGADTPDAVLVADVPKQV